MNTLKQLFDGKRKISLFLAFMIFMLLSAGIFTMQKNTESGVLVSPAALVMHKRATLKNVLDWQIETGGAQKYQVMFRTLFMKVAKSHPHFTTLEGFFKLYYLANILCLTLAVYAFFLFLLELKIKFKTALLGGCLFLTCFPILFSHQFPVNSRGGDFLAYFFISLILIRVLRDQWKPIFLLCLVGVWAKENVALALIPFLILSKHPIGIRLLTLTAPAIGIFIARHIQGPMQEGYFLKTFKQGLHQNYGDLSQTLLYTLLVFGALWFFALRGYFVSELRQNSRLHKGLFIFGLPLLIFVVYNLTGAYFYENRIFFVLFPWVLALCVSYFSSTEFKQCIRSKSFLVTLVVCILASAQFLNQVHDDPQLVSTIQQHTSEIFEPGFQSGKSFGIVEENGQLMLDYQYSSTPWGGLHTCLHLTVLLSYVAGMIELKVRHKKRVPEDTL